MFVTVLCTRALMCLRVYLHDVRVFVECRADWCSSGEADAVV